MRRIIPFLIPPVLFIIVVTLIGSIILLGYKDPTSASAAVAHDPALQILTTPVSALTLSQVDWVTLRPGMELYSPTVFDNQNIAVENLTILRIDPANFRFDIAYHSTPQSLSDWQAQTGALLVVNGGYFSEENGVYTPTGLTILNGSPLGASYQDYGGMFVVTQNGPDLRSLVDTPYNPSEELISGLQSFPMLVRPGGVMGFPEQYEDNQTARRTVVAKDRLGRILFITASRGFFTLHMLSEFLTGSGMDLDMALNLDGGPSTGLLLAEPRTEVPAGTALPIVILVYPK